MNEWMNDFHQNGPLNRAVTFEGQGKVWFWVDQNDFGPP